MKLMDRCILQCFISACLNINSLPNDKIVDWFNLKASADDKIRVTEKLKFVLGRIESIMGKGENAPFPIMFSKGPFFRVVKNPDCVVKR